MTAIRDRLAADVRIACAILFGSTATGAAHPHSDVDIAIGVVPGASLTATDLGILVADLEQSLERTVDLVLLDEATPTLAYRIFRDGRTLFARDPRALATRKARAILDYLDFLPTEEVLARGVLAAAAHGR